MSAIYTDRRDAGRSLARELQKLSGERDMLVLALPRGGVPVGYEIAQALDVPLDLLIVRKLGFPGQEELAMGAIASGGSLVFNEELLSQSSVEQSEIDAVIERERVELGRRETLYRGDRPPIEVTGKLVILVDDGLATGSTMFAAVNAIKQQHPRRIIVAVPVAPGDTVRLLESQVDTVVCPATPTPFGGVGRWYGDFQQTGDDEVRALLDRTSHISEPRTGT